MKRLLVVLLSGVLVTVFGIPRSPIRAQTGDVPAERLTYGDLITRTFEADTGTFVFSFAAEAGDVITITMQTHESALDPAITLFGPGTSEVAQNDDSLDEAFGQRNARLVNFPVPQAGMYTIHATRGSDAEGDFTLTLRGQHKNQTPLGITYNQTRTGQVTARATSNEFEFRARPGEVVSVTATADGSFTPSVTLLDAQDRVIATSSPVDKAPRIASLQNLLIDDEGTYTVVVARATDMPGPATGTYKLAVKRILSASLLQIGRSASGTFSKTKREARYVFEGKSGDLVTISLNASSNGSLDPVLTLRSVDDKPLATNDNATGQGLQRGDAQITDFELPADGIYIIVAGAKGSSQGSYQLSVSF